MRPRLIEISGAPYEMGRQLGFKARKYIRAGVVFYQKNWLKMTGLTWSKSRLILRSSLGLTKRLLPQTWAELEGMAKGSGVNFTDLFLINSMEALSRFEKCTSVIVKIEKGRLLLAHNEDWVAADQKWLYLVQARPLGEPAFLSLTYGAWLPNYGLNEAGLAYTADSQTARDARVGLSQTLIGREVMRAKTISEIVRRITHLPRADGHTYLVINRKGEAVALETTARRHTLLKIDAHRFLAHTNFYQSSVLVKLECGPRTYARFRFGRLKEFLVKKNHWTKDKLFALLSDHLNFPESVCRHLPNQLENFKEETIASFIMDPLAQEISIRFGHPCGLGQTQKFSLAPWPGTGRVSTLSGPFSKRRG